MKLFKVRNVIAVIAVAMTTILFTVLASVVFSIVLNYQQMNFLKIGTYNHGEFQNMTSDQVDELKDDKKIDDYGLKCLVGTIENTSTFGEVCYLDENASEWSFIEFEEGGLPSENTNEIAADSKLLEELGVDRKIGAEFSAEITDKAGNVHSETYVLSGWWDRNEYRGVSTLIIPESGIISISPESHNNYDMLVMLKDDNNIDKTMHSILNDHNIVYDKNGEAGAGISVNSGYLNNEKDNSLDAGSVVAIVILVVLIILMGYLIIYNIFHISVSNDIRHYGMLKTIGASGKQIKSLVYIQAIILSLIGTFIGLIIGYIVGIIVVPKMLDMLGSDFCKTSSDPLIFILPVLFSIVTVFLSCTKPAKLASKVSPVEALNHFDAKCDKKNERDSRMGNYIIHMAWRNVWLSKSKAIITFLSIALSIVLFHVTVVFVNGIDKDTYVESKIVSDYIIADKSYFDGDWDASKGIDSRFINSLGDLDDDLDLGVAYVTDYAVSCEVKESDVKKVIYNDDELYESVMSSKSEDGKYSVSAKLYGMDDFCFDNLKLLEGDFDKLKNGGRYVVLLKDALIPELPSYNVGDMMPVCFKSKPTIIDRKTNKVYENIEDAPESVEIIKGDIITQYYEVAAIAELPRAMSAREVSYINLAVTYDQLEAEVKAPIAMYCMLNVEDKSKLEFIKSKLMAMSDGEYIVEDVEDAEKEYSSFRSVIIMLGMVMCFVVGFVGILNFFNNLLTSVISRKHEIAVLESIGMTKKQVKRMLTIEGLIYTAGSAILILLICLIVTPVLGKLFEQLFWFYVYKATFVAAAVVIPVFVVIGCVVPKIIYKCFMKGTSIEKLRAE